MTTPAEQNFHDRIAADYLRSLTPGMVAQYVSGFTPDYLLSKSPPPESPLPHEHATAIRNFLLESLGRAAVRGIRVENLGLPEWDHDHIEMLERLDEPWMPFRPVMQRTGSWPEDLSQALRWVYASSARALLPRLEELQRRAAALDIVEPAQTKLYVLRPEQDAT